LQDEEREEGSAEHAGHAGEVEEAESARGVVRREEGGVSDGGAVIGVELGDAPREEEAREEVAEEGAPGARLEPVDWEEWEDDDRTRGEGEEDDGAPLGSLMPSGGEVGTANVARYDLKSLFGKGESAQERDLQLQRA
jgi:hypothetical protein